MFTVLYFSKYPLENFKRIGKKGYVKHQPKFPRHGHPAAVGIGGGGCQFFILRHAAIDGIRWLYLSGTPLPVVATTEGH